MKTRVNIQDASNDAELLGRMCAWKAGLCLSDPFSGPYKLSNCQDSCVASDELVLENVVLYVKMFISVEARVSRLELVHFNCNHNCNRVVRRRSKRDTHKAHIYSICVHTSYVYPVRPCKTICACYIPRASLGRQRQGRCCSRSPNRGAFWPPRCMYHNRRANTLPPSPKQARPVSMPLTQGCKK